MLPVEQQLEILKRGVVDLVSEAELRTKLERSVRTGRPLRVKIGADPTAPDIHLGHTVPLRKLRQFQDLGHTVVFIIGDFTGLVGDPSGRSKTRLMLDPEEVQRNARTYEEQIYKILDPARTELTFNSRWSDALSFREVLALTSRYTVARLLERNDFKKRYEGGSPITLMELLYPLLQAYDSVAINADVEIGGTDQLFNLLVGRDIQTAYGQEPQVVLTMPLLVGLDGTEKMSKSLGNYIGINEPPEEIYGKCMSVPDELMLDYFALCTGLEAAKIEEYGQDLAVGENPKTVKEELGRCLVGIYHGAEAATAAQRSFDTQFSRELSLEEKLATMDVPEVVVPPEELEQGRVRIGRLLVLAGLAESGGEAKRLVTGGGVRVDDERITDKSALIDLGVSRVVQVSNRKFVRVRKG
jgi:tyrosyl-tRNA synthetase